MLQKYEFVITKRILLILNLVHCKIVHKVTQKIHGYFILYYHIIHESFGVILNALNLCRETKNESWAS
jgi:hypothetical protein